jgi:hypothetical protein
MKNVALLNESNIVLNIIVVKDDFNQQNYVEYSDDNPAFIGGDFNQGYFYPTTTLSKLGEIKWNLATSNT